MRKSAIRELRSRIPEKKKRGRWKKWLVLIPLLLVLAGAIYMVNLPRYQIQNVAVKGAVLTNDDDVRQIAEKQLSGDYLLVIPRSFFWIYPKGDIEDKIEALPSVLQATSSFDLGTHTLTVALTERKQEYVWCPPLAGGEATASSSDMEEASTTDALPSSQCYYMDKDGLVFVAAPEFEGNAFLTFRGLVDPANPVGKTYLPEAEMTSLLSFIDGVKGLGLVPVAVNASSPREVHVTLQSGTDLIVTLEEPLAGVTKNIATLLQSSDFETASGGLDKLQYLDLRYGNKAFWK